MQNVDKRMMSEFVESIRSDKSFLAHSSHNMFIYDDVKSFETFYAENVAKWLPLNDIVLIGSQYQTLDKVRSALDKRGIDTTKHMDDGTLIIIDAQQGYVLADMYDTFKLALTLTNRVRKEGRRGLSWIGDLSSFIAFHRIEDMMKYELSFPEKFEDEVIRTVCCYHQADFAKLPQEHKDTLLKHHFKSMIVL